MTGALQAARTFQPDVIVPDIMLPGMARLEVSQTLRRESNVLVEAHDSKIWIHCDGVGKRSIFGFSLPLCTA